MFVTVTVANPGNYSLVFVRWQHTIDGFYVRQQNASHIASVCLFVCPSVCLSHSWAVSKRCKLGSRHLHHSCFKASSFSWQNFVPLGAGIPHERGRQRGHSLKDDILPLWARIVWKRLQICTYMLLIITSTGDRLFRFININDLDDLKLPKKAFSEFFTIFGCNAHFNTELRCNGWR